MSPTGCESRTYLRPGALEHEIGPVGTGLWDSARAPGSRCWPLRPTRAWPSWSWPAAARSGRPGRCARKPRDGCATPASGTTIRPVSASCVLHGRTTSVGTCPRVQAQQVVNRFVARPWFPLSWVPPVLPDTVIWDDMTWPGCSRPQGGLRTQLARAEIRFGLRERRYPPGGYDQ